MAGQSRVPFIHLDTGEPVDALAQAEIITSSAPLCWDGVHVEVGQQSGPWDVHHLSVRDHYLALNTDQTPLHFEAVINGRGRPITLDPGEMWFCPAGETFSHKVNAPSGFALVTLSPSRVTRLLGEEMRPLTRQYSVHHPQLAHLIQALSAEAASGGPGGALFVDALSTALATQIIRRFGAPDEPPSAEARPDRRLRRALDFIESELGDPLTVVQIAEVAGLSPARFARVFKAAFGESPWRYVMRRRLETARRLLEAPGADVLNVALVCGFSDQAHLTRLFKRQFGMTPGRFIHSR